MRSRARTGFTLIELMVAMALMLFIMVILSEAFVLSLEAFSKMKGLGDMHVNVRTAEVSLRDDLGQDHFTGKRRLSDVNSTGAARIISPAEKPAEGFFAVVRGTPSTYEGADAFAVPSYRAVDQMLYMTVKRKGNRQENFFNTALLGNSGVLEAFFGQTTAYNMNPVSELPAATWTPPYAVGSGSTTGFYASQWAEVFYYLVRTGSTQEPNVPTSAIGTPTYALYRAQFAMVPDRTGVNTLYTPGNGYSPANIGTLAVTTFSGVSCNPTLAGLVFNSPADASVGQRMIPDFTTFNLAADPRFTNVGNLVLPNVVSFHVQIMPIGAAAFGDVPNNAGQTYGIYDTARFGTAGYPVFGLRAIQITLRVWDPGTRQTLQTTLVQDL